MNTTPMSSWNLRWSQTNYSTCSSRTWRRRTRHWLCTNTSSWSCLIRMTWLLCEKIKVRKYCAILILSIKRTYLSTKAGKAKRSFGQSPSIPVNANSSKVRNAKRSRMPTQLHPFFHWISIYPTSCQSSKDNKERGWRSTSISRIFN